MTSTFPQHYLSFSTLQHLYKMQAKMSTRSVQAARRPFAVAAPKVGRRALVVVANEKQGKGGEVSDSGLNEWIKQVVGGTSLQRRLRSLEAIAQHVFIYFAIVCAFAPLRWSRCMRLQFRGVGCVVRYLPIAHARGTFISDGAQ